ncbi:MAG: glycosyltransferase family 1 protein [Parasphingorhabdus sp.]
MNPTAVALSKRGHAVDFVRMEDHSAYKQLDQPQGIAFVDIDVPPRRTRLSTFWQQYSFLRQFSAYLERYTPDIVHTNFAVPGIIARYLAASHGAKVVTTHHELYGSMNAHYRLGTRLTQARADALIYVSNVVAKSFPAGPRNESHSKHYVIHNGIDVEAVTRLRSQNNPARNAGELLCVGRMVPEKGQSLLVRALAGLHDAYPALKVRFIGSGPDEGRLKHEARDLGVEDNIDFEGWKPRDSVLKAMQSCTAFVIPSDGTQEGFGLVAAEALACGAPVLASNIPVFQEVLGEVGMNCAFEPGSVGSLVNAIRSLLENLPDRIKNAEELSDRAINAFSAETMTEQYLKVYRDVLDDREL